MSGWGCPHDVNGVCQRVPGRDCDPGMKGCVLFGRFRWADDAKNRPSGARRRAAGTPREPDANQWQTPIENWSDASAAPADHDSTVHIGGHAEDVMGAMESGPGPRIERP